MIPMLPFSLNRFLLGTGFALGAGMLTASLSLDARAQEVRLADDPATAQFALLQTLVGTWVVEEGDGRAQPHSSAHSPNPALTLDFKLIANGTVLVETWTTASGRQTMNVYHRDGGTLMVTHYCAQGNQPRLTLVQDWPAGTLRFTYKDATNLPSLANAHLHDLTVKIIGQNRLMRSETYQSDLGPDAETLTFRRSAPDGHARAERHQTKMR